jgi:hypothetical protein
MPRHEPSSHQDDDDRVGQQADSAPAPSVRRGPITAGLALTPWLLPALAVAIPPGFATWIVLVLTFFGDSEDYWPGFVCAVPAVLVGGIVFWAGVRATAYIFQHPWERTWVPGAADWERSTTPERPARRPIPGEDDTRSVRR